MSSSGGATSSSSTPPPSSENQDEPSSDEVMEQLVAEFEQVVLAHPDAPKLTPERLQFLEQKHRAYHWQFASDDTTRGPEPTPSELEEYRSSKMLRDHALWKLYNQHSKATNSSPGVVTAAAWDALEKFYQDFSTNGFYWVELHLGDLGWGGFVGRGVAALKLLHEYAGLLLMNPEHSNPKLALKVLHWSGLALRTLKTATESPDDLFNFMPPDFTHNMLATLAFAALGDLRHAQRNFFHAIMTEHLYRKVGGWEYKDQQFPERFDMEKFMNRVSALQIVSITLNIPTQQLDGESGKRLLLSLSDAQVRKCTERFGKNVGIATSPVPYCINCWATATTMTAATADSKSGGGGSSLRVCGKCQKVYYCSRGCQRCHWDHHKKSCRKARLPMP